MVAHAPAPRVLITDGEYYIGRVLEAKLAKEGRFQVISVTSGQDALQMALEQAFDVMLWDMRLRDTFSLLPRLRALSPRAVLFLMTTDDRPMLNPDVQRLDISGVLIKPFGLDTLVEQLNLALAEPLHTHAPASVELARVGQLLTILSPDGACATRVLERAHEVFSVTGAPRVETPPDFATGLKVEVQVRGEDALYTFSSRLLQFHPSPVPRWDLRMPRAIHRDQQRRHPRLPLHIEVTLNPEEGEAPADSPKDSRAGTAQGTTDDLSLGGCAIVSAHPLPVGAEVEFDLRDGSQPVLGGRGRIVRVQPALPQMTVAEISESRYRIAVEFTDMEPSARRRLREIVNSRH